MQAFDGVRILDLTHVLAGPFAAYQLALFGADVIKIENPLEPDQSRETGPDQDLNDARMGVFFLTQGSNKRTMTLNLKHAAARAVLCRMVAQADVLVENYRPGALAELGLGHEALREINPRLIYCSISAFGHTGPRLSQTAYDIVIQAAAGLMTLNGPANSVPIRLGVPVIDYATGMMGAFALSAALFQRERTGLGQHVDLAMFDVAKLIMASTVTSYLHTGVTPKANGNVLSLATQGVFVTGDGLLMIAANNFRQQMRLWTYLGMPERATRDARTRTHNTSADRRVLERVFVERGAEEWEIALQGVQVPAARIRDLHEAMTDTQSVARRTFEAVGLDEGPFFVPSSPFKLSDSPAILHSAPRPMGADTVTILRDHGYDGAEIAVLRASQSI